MTAQKIVELYTSSLLEHKKSPKSVEDFLNDNNIKESDFNNHFASLTDLEKSIFVDFFDETIDLLENNEQYHEFDPANKLLSFYFTFFEILSANNALVHLLIPGNVYITNRLEKLKTSFAEYIETLAFDKLNIPLGAFEQILNKGEQNIYWLQLLSIFNYWLKDTSKDFEQTDVFIEKSISLSVNILNPQPINSFIDFTKFLFQKDK